MIDSQWQDRGRGGRALGSLSSWTRSLRRLILAATSRLQNRRFALAFVTAAVLGTKVVHILAHRKALPPKRLKQWGCSLFAQDILLLILLRFLLDRRLFSASRTSWLRSLASSVLSAVIAYVAFVSVISITFFVDAGSEIHWRNIAFAKDASSRALLLSGLVSFIIVLFTLIAVAWVAQNAVFIVLGLTTDMIDWARTFLVKKVGSFSRANVRYSEIPQAEKDNFDEAEDGMESRKKEFLQFLFLESQQRWGTLLWKLCHLLLGIALLAEFVLVFLRPRESSLTFMSWTAPFLPFVGWTDSSPSLRRLTPVFGPGNNYQWDNRTALGKPIPLSWLPQDSVPMGFEDWYGEDTLHYNAANDPLKISNLNEDFLPQLKNLEDVSIRHVLVLFLESTRKDVFPIKKDELIFNRFEETFKNQHLSEEALERLQTLTPTAKYLTGDYDDGFDGDAKGPIRGGISFEDAYTTGTYTLKSLVGSLCGAWPLIADFNLEYAHHFYQPCLPQILDAFNGLNHSEPSSSDSYTSFNWRSSFLQSVTLEYDNFDRLIPAMGFPDDHIISKTYLKRPDAKFGYVDLPDVNYFGMAESPLEDYIRDEFVSAKNSDERVFMTHITSTSHHPYVMPAEEPYVPLASGKGLDDLSHYVNSIGYDDRWIRTILDVLEEQGVANETLIVFAGDHGLSIPENDILASYYNPNVGCNHVPLGVSHPQLPHISIDDSVSSIEILPTILDLLIETGSFSPAASQAARDLVANYEGQSLIRKLQHSAPSKQEHATVSGGNETSIGNWQFIVMNPGRAMVGVRDARQKYWRLVAPVIDNVAWRFTDLESDPTEASPTMGFEFSEFLKQVERDYGLEAAMWTEEAAFVTRWWVEENSKRWRYGPYAVGES